MDDFNIFYILGIIVIFSSVLFLAYISTKYLAGKSEKMREGKLLKLIENICLGKDRYLHLVKVGDEFILLSSSGKGIEFLKNISLENYDEYTANTQTFFSFKSVFEKKLKNFTEKKTNDKSTGLQDTELQSTEFQNIKLKDAGLKDVEPKGADFKINLKKIGDMVKELKQTGRSDSK